MIDLGFSRGIASGCLFYHPVRKLRCTVYGDDFTTIGAATELDWFEGELQNMYAITQRGRLGPGVSDLKEATLLNRVVRWCDNTGIELEADPRQAERIIDQLSLQ